MSRYQGEFTAAGETSLTAAEYRELRNAAVEGRHEAIARCLAAGEGWKEALLQLGGAFAATPPPVSRLSRRQGE